MTKPGDHITHIKVRVEYGTTNTSGETTFRVRDGYKPKEVLLASIRELCRLASVDGYGDEACQMARDARRNVRKWMKEKGSEAIE